MRSYLRSMSASNRNSGTCRAGQPAVFGDLVFKLASAPSGVAKRHQRVTRPPAGRNRAQYIDGRRQADIVRHRQRGLDRIIAGMQNEATAAVDRAAIAHDEVPGLGWKPDSFLLLHDSELHQKVGEQHLLRLVDDQAHRALVAVSADIDHRTREPAVLHAGHGNQELVVQKTAHRGFFLPQEVHEMKITRFRRA